MGNVEQRLQALEQDLRRSRRTNRVLVVLAVAVASFAGAQGQGPGEPADPWQGQLQAPDDQRREAPQGHPNRPLSVATNRLVLVDRAGRERAVMEAADGGTSIVLRDQLGRKRMELSQTEAGSQLSMLDSDLSPRLSLRLPGNGSAAEMEIGGAGGSSLVKSDGLFVRDGAGRGAVHLALLNGNFPVLGIGRSDNGPPPIELTASGDSRSLKLHDGRGRALLSFRATDAGRGSLELRDPDRERSLQISSGSGSDDGPEMVLFGPAGEDGTGGILPLARLGLDRGGLPVLRIVDRGGLPVFTAPQPPGP